MPALSTLYPLFFLSGMSALVFETLWQRKLMHVFGASAPSITVILTAFFCGMAFGSWGGGRMLSRYQRRFPTLRFYAFTEIWIGVFGISVPLLLRAVDGLYVAVFSQYDPDPFFSIAYRFVMCTAVVLPASLGMGATIPVMSRLISEHGRGVGTSVSLAYGINTLGAVLGCFATGFVLLEHLGIQDSLFLASGLNALVVISALALSRGAAPSAAGAPEAPAPALRSARRRALLAMYFTAGFLAIGFEVVWFRMLAIFTSNSITTFTLGLSVYLTGFSLGSLVLYRWLERRLTGLQIFFVSSLGVALVGVLVTPNAQSITNSIWASLRELGNGPESAYWRFTAVELGNALYLMLPASLFMGLAFPAVCQAVTEHRERIALSSGFIYFVGNIGSVAGAVVTGLVLVPWLSLNGAAGLLIATSCALAIAALQLGDAPARRLVQAACAGLFVPTALIGLSDAPYLHYGDVVREGDAWRIVEGDRRTNARIIAHRTGASATVTVREVEAARRSDRMIYIDDQPVAATQRWSAVDSKMLAHIPFLIHPEPRTALTVGFGSGGTSWSMTIHGVQTDVVEIEREVIRAAPLFEMQNFGVMRSPLLHVIVNDARNHLYVTRKKYDVISTDVTNLQYKQNGSLYTREYFELMKERLTEGGIACAWIPLGLPEAEFATLLATWQAVFPNASFWFMDQTRTTFAILLGTPEPIRFDAERLKRGFAIDAVREDLASIGVFHPFHLVQFMYLDETGFRRFTGDAPLHTDDHPILEFASHVSAYVNDATIVAQMERLWALRPPTLRPRVAHLSAPAEVQEFERYEAFARALGRFTNHRHFDPDGTRGSAEFYRKGLRLLDRALAAVPDYPHARRQREIFRERLADERG